MNYKCKFLGNYFQKNFHRSPITVYRLLNTDYRLLFTVYYLLFTVYCLLFTFNPSTLPVHFFLKKSHFIPCHPVDLILILPLHGKIS